MTALFIALGGAAGALARYGLGGWVQNRAGFAFPWGTLAVNVSGCLLLGLAAGLFQGVRLTPDLRALITIGFLGAFTTFSTFGYETVVLIQEGAWVRAAAYALGSVAVGVVAVWVGLRLGAVLLPVRA